MPYTQSRVCFKRHGDVFKIKAEQLRDVEGELFRYDLLFFFLNDKLTYSKYPVRFVHYAPAGQHNDAPAVGYRSWHGPSAPDNDSTLATSSGSCVR